MGLGTVAERGEAIARELARPIEVLRAQAAFRPHFGDLAAADVARGRRLTCRVSRRVMNCPHATFITGILHRCWLRALIC